MANVLIHKALNPTQFPKALPITARHANHFTLLHKHIWPIPILRCTSETNLASYTS
jgi:hypothetical protein